MASMSERGREKLTEKVNKKFSGDIGSSVLDVVKGSTDGKACKLPRLVAITETETISFAHGPMGPKSIIARGPRMTGQPNGRGGSVTLGSEIINLDKNEFKHLASVPRTKPTGRSSFGQGLAAGG